MELNIICKKENEKKDKTKKGNHEKERSLCRMCIFPQVPFLKNTTLKTTFCIEKYIISVYIYIYR